MRLCVIFNPAAKGEKAKRFRRHLDTIGVDCALKPTTRPGGGRELALEALCEGYETIVAAGGDGTMNEVLNGIGDAPDGFARVRLAVLPLGTANVFARELRVPIHLRRAWDVIRRGRERKIDLPQAEFSANGKIERRYFAQLAGAGVDARAVELVDWATKKKTGYGAYIVAGLKAVGETKPEISVTGPNCLTSGEQVVVGNGRLYGGPFLLFPQATLGDGLLDVCVIPRANWAAVAACAVGVVTGTLSRRAGMRHFQAESFSLTAPKRTPLELDGELVGDLPAKFGISPEKLRVIVP
jgi:diacylglycerol kinase (ATP)